MKYIESKENIEKIQQQLINLNFNNHQDLLEKYLFRNQYGKNKYNLKSYSGQGQDNIVYDLLEKKENGIFLDIGANHFKNSNNTYGLETQLNWTGTLVEINESYKSLYKDNRKAFVYPCGFKNVNGTTNINDIIATTNSTEIDYLSLDIDGDEEILITSIDFNKYSFTILDIEHDLYRPKMLRRRNNIVSHLEKNGYSYLISNAVDDFFVKNSFLEKAKANLNNEYGYNLTEILNIK